MITMTQYLFILYLRSLFEYNLHKYPSNIRGHTDYVPTQMLWTDDYDRYNICS